MVELQTFNLMVGGSIPSRPTIASLHFAQAGREGIWDVAVVAGAPTARVAILSGAIGDRYGYSGMGILSPILRSLMRVADSPPVGWCLADTQALQS